MMGTSPHALPGEATWKRWPFTWALKCRCVQGRGQVMLWAQGHQREPLGSNSGWYSDNKLQR